jgi:hypothetical protein
VDRRRASLVPNHAHGQIQLSLFAVIAVFGDAHGLALVMFFGSIEPKYDNRKG